MPAGIESIALLTPIIASNAVFSTRRASKAVDNLEEKPIYAATNGLIASGQILNGARAVKGLSIASNVSAKTAIENAVGTTKVATTATNTAKTLTGIAKVVDVVADNINPVICLAGGIRVLGEENKTEAAAEEILRLGCMFGAESITKQALGMPYYKKVMGQKVAFERKNPFLKQQCDAMEEFCATKKLFNKVSLKGVPGVVKGLLFVGASIGGYQVGDKLAKELIYNN